MIYKRFEELVDKGKLPSSIIIDSNDTASSLKYLKKFVSEKMFNSLINLDEHPDFYFVEKPSAARDIPIERIRLMQQFLYKKPAIANLKVAIIFEAELMNLNSSNSLLKVLEEVPPNTYIFLITSKSSSLIQTILSRCVIFQDIAVGTKQYNFTYDDFTKLLNDKDLALELEIIKKLKSKDRELWREIASHALVYFRNLALNHKNMIEKFDYISSIINDAIEYDLDLSASFIILLNELRAL